MFSGKVAINGTLSARLIPAQKAPLAWRIKNALRPSYLWGLAINDFLAPAFHSLTGVPILTSQLSARLIRADGEVIDYGVISRRVVTTAGVTYLCTDWQASVNHISNFNFHGAGIGTTAEAIGDTALVTESTTALNPDNTRATGTKTNPSANVLQTVGTLTFDASAAITEHGIFTQSATGGGTLWDRSVFAAINVASGDSIQFTYQVTFTAGG